METTRDYRPIERPNFRFCGACEYEADGSYIATRWACIYHMPFFPLYSALIHSAEPASFWDDYKIYHCTRMPRIHWPQVMRTYAFVGAVWAFVIYGSQYLRQAEVSVLLIIPLGLPLFLLPWLLQRRARQDAMLD